MSGRPPRVGVLFASPADRRLLREFLQGEGYEVFAPEPGGWAGADLAGMDLILVEAELARKFQNELLDLKNRFGAAFSFLPVLVAHPHSEAAAPWLAAGFDDVLPLPIVKPLLSVRVRTWLRIRAETAGRFRALVEESPIGFYRTTPDGRLLYANPALARLLGFASPAELAQHNLEELAQRMGYPRARFRELLEREGQIQGFECAWVRPDGRRFWTRENARVVRDGFGRVLYYEGTVEDITRAMEAREAYFTVVENSLQALAVLQDGRIVFGNPALEQLCGRALAELMALSPEEVLGLVHPEDRAWVAERMQRGLAGEPVPALSEFRFIHKDGSTRWVRALARRIAFAGRPAILASFLDITEERRLSERLNAVGELGRKLVTSRSPEAVARAVVEGACALVGFTEVSLYLLDERANELVLLAHSLGEPHGPRRLPLSSEKGVVVRAARTGEVQNVADVSQEPAYIRAYPQNRSELALPLKVAGRVVGVLNVESERPAAFGPEEERILTTLADVAAVALENARLFQEMEDLRRFHEEIVQTLAEGVVLVDAEGRIAFANPAAARLGGYELPEALGRSWRDFVAPPFWGLVEEELRRRAQGQESTYELEIVRKDGSTFPALVHARPLFREGKFQGSLVAFTDVTLLKEFEARYRHFAEQTEEGFYRVEFPTPLDPELAEADLEPALGSAVLVDANDALARHYGFARAAELVGRPFRELVPGSVDPGLLQVFREFLRNGGRLTNREVPVRLPDGSTRWIAYTAVGFYTNGKLRAIWGTQRDVTARKVAEERLREAEERYRSLVEQIPGVVYLLDLERPLPQKTVYISPQVQTLFGFSPEEWLADPELWVRQIHPEDRARVVETAQVLNGERQPYDLTYRIVTRDGRTLWIRNLVNVIRGPDGTARFAHGILLDITPLKRAEEERLAFARRVERAFQEVVEAFSAAMDLRDPYTAGHQRRVAELACAIAQELGLAEERVRGLRVAALLHDVGKALFVPIEILSKPGKLTDLEMALIREHPRAGYEILRRVEFPWPVAEIVHQHHERLDGSGYPRGLKGEAILLEARILAVADVVEAMSSHRPYRPALGVEAALAEIREMAGKLYDPKVVEACLRVFARGFQFPKVF